MDAVFQEYQAEDEKKAKIGTIIWIIALLLIIIYPWMKFQDPPPGQEGILVNLGIPDVGQGDENATASSTDSAEAEPTESDSETPPETSDEPQPDEPTEDEPSKAEPQPVDDKKVIENDAEDVALKKKKEKERKEAEAKKKKEREKARKKKAAEEAKKKAEEEAKRKKAEAEAKKKAEEAKKKAEAEALKNQLGGLLGGGSGNGNNGSEGNSGDPNGDPNSNILDGISTGAGKVGGGLANRGGSGPTITDNSQETGRIVMKVCVDGSGNVLSAEYTQAGSTSSSARLKQLAKANAKKWKFKGAGIDKQCGTITYDFKVK